MTRQGMLLAMFGLFMMVCVSGASAAGWQDNAFYDHASWAQGQSASTSNGLIHLGSTGTKIAKLGLDAAGTVVAGLLGSHFGTIGTVVGGAAGFFVSKWIGGKLFGTESDGSAGGNGQGWLSQIRTRVGTDDNASDSTQRTARWSRIKSLLPGGDDNLETSRRNFLTAMQNLQNTLASGDQTAKASALDSYNQARDAYFAAKNGQH